MMISLYRLEKPDGGDSEGLHQNVHISFRHMIERA